jgi:hypothetical protein
MKNHRKEIENLQSYEELDDFIEKIIPNTETLDSFSREEMENLIADIKEKFGEPGFTVLETYIYEVLGG